MSSSYHLLCLNHDPALEITDPGWNTAEEADASAANRTEPALRSHGACDLVITRTSGALIALGCPSRSHSDRYHREIVWCSVAWLRLLACAIAEAPHGSALSAATEPLVRTCWTVERLTRLRAQLAAETSCELDGETYG